MHHPHPLRVAILSLAVLWAAGPAFGEPLPDYPEADSLFGMNGVFNYSDEQASLQRLDPRGVMAVVAERDVAFATELGVRHYRGQPGDYAGFAQNKMDGTGAGGAVDFSRTDALVHSAQRVGFNVLPVLALHADPAALAEGGGRYVPQNLDGYTAWVRAVVERYDGDGQDDMPDLRFRIADWQVENTPDLLVALNDGGFASVDDYVRLLSAAAAAVKAADPRARIVIGAVSSADKRDKGLALLDAVLNSPAAAGVDVMAFEYLPRTLTSTELREALAAVKARAGGRPIWCTLGGSYSRYTPRNAMRDRAASETTQAAELVRRYSYMVANGVTRIYESGMTEDGPDQWRKRTFYSGLRGHDGSAKLAYASYRLVVRVLSPIQRDLSNVLSDGQNDLVILQFRRQAGGVPVFVIWWDYAVTKAYKAGQLEPDAAAEVPLKLAYDLVEVGEMVRESGGAFETISWQPQDGELTLPLRRVPVMLRADAIESDSNT